eukprot:767493-Hanusia_phi.AAC.2
MNHNVIFVVHIRHKVHGRAPRDQFLAGYAAQWLVFRVHSMKTGHSCTARDLDANQLPANVTLASISLRQSVRTKKSTRTPRSSAYERRKSLQKDE